MGYDHPLVASSPTSQAHFVREALAAQLPTYLEDVAAAFGDGVVLEMPTIYQTPRNNGYPDYPSLVVTPTQGLYGSYVGSERINRDYFVALLEVIGNRSSADLNIDEYLIQQTERIAHALWILFQENPSMGDFVTDGQGDPVRDDRDRPTFEDGPINWARIEQTEHSAIFRSRDIEDVAERAPSVVPANQYRRKTAIIFWTEVDSDNLG